MWVYTSSVFFGAGDGEHAAGGAAGGKKKVLCWSRLHNNMSKKALSVPGQRAPGSEINEREPQQRRRRSCEYWRDGERRIIN